MGASDRFARTIPKQQIAGTAQWELQPFDEAARGGRPKTISPRPADSAAERERAAFGLGREQGYNDAMRIAQQARAADIERLDRLLAQMHAQFDELHTQAADQVLDIALEVARQVIRREVVVQRDAVLGVVREALALVADHQSHPRVHLSARDFELVRGALEDDGLYRGCRFVADPGVEPGGCRVETPQGEVDATLTTRWCRVLRALGCEWPAPLAAGDPPLTPSPSPSRGEGEGRAETGFQPVPES